MVFLFTIIVNLMMFLPTILITNHSITIQKPKESVGKLEILLMHLLQKVVILNGLLYKIDIGKTKLIIIPETILQVTLQK